MSTHTSTSSTRTQILRSLSSTSIRPAKKKPRLYIVLYPRGGSSTTSSFRNDFNCDSYHWSLVVAPPTASRQDPGTRYHVAHLDPASSPGKYTYFYEEQDIPSSAAAQTGLVRVTVAKVTDESRLQALLRDVPVRQDDSAFNCLTWVREAFVKLLADGKSAKSYLRTDDWKLVEACARAYCKRKRDVGRFQDQSPPAAVHAWRWDEISTFNFWENRETTA